MADSSWALQVTIFDVLDTGLAVPVYDEVYDGADETYVEIGDSTTTDASNKTDDGQEHTISISVWGKNRQAVKEVYGDIYSLLHKKEIVIAGHGLVSCRFEFASTVGRDGDDWHGVVRYRISIS